MKLSLVVFLIGISSISYSAEMSADSTLDTIVSPFEDITEAALEKNIEHMQVAFTKAQAAELIIKTSLDSENYKKFSKMFLELEKSVKFKDFDKISSNAVELFYINSIGFLRKQELTISFQIELELLDYTGFKLLTLINKKNINWKELAKTSSFGQETWKKTMDKIKNNELSDAVSRNIETMNIAVIERNKKITILMANQILALVDLLEKNKLLVKNVYVVSSVG